MWWILQLMLLIWPPEPPRRRALRRERWFRPATQSRLTVTDGRDPGDGWEYVGGWVEERTR